MMHRLSAPLHVWACFVLPAAAVRLIDESEVGLDRVSHAYSSQSSLSLDARRESGGSGGTVFEDELQRSLQEQEASALQELQDQKAAIATIESALATAKAKVAKAELAAQAADAAKMQQNRSEAAAREAHSVAQAAEVLRSSKAAAAERARRAAEEASVAQMASAEGATKAAAAAKIAEALRSAELEREAEVARSSEAAMARAESARRKAEMAKQAQELAAEAAKSAREAQRAAEEADAANAAKQAEAQRAAEATQAVEAARKSLREAEEAKTTAAAEAERAATKAKEARDQKAAEDAAASEAAKAESSAKALEVAKQTELVKAAQALEETEKAAASQALLAKEAQTSAKLAKDTAVAQVAQHVAASQSLLQTASREAAARDDFEQEATSRFHEAQHQLVGAASRHRDAERLQASSRKALRDKSSVFKDAIDEKVWTQELSGREERERAAVNAASLAETDDGVLRAQYGTHLTLEDVAIKAAHDKVREEVLARVRAAQDAKVKAAQEAMTKDALLASARRDVTQQMSSKRKAAALLQNAQAHRSRMLRTKQVAEQETSLWKKLLSQVSPDKQTIPPAASQQSSLLEGVGAADSTDVGLLPLDVETPRLVEATPIADLADDSKLLIPKAELRGDEDVRLGETALPDARTIEDSSGSLPGSLEEVSSGLGVETEDESLRLAAAVAARKKVVKEIARKEQALETATQLVHQKMVVEQKAIDDVHSAKTTLKEVKGRRQVAEEEGAVLMQQLLAAKKRAVAAARPPHRHRGGLLEEDETGRAIEDSDSGLDEAQGVDGDLGLAATAAAAEKVRADLAKDDREIEAANKAVARATAVEAKTALQVKSALQKVVSLRNDVQVSKQEVSELSTMLRGSQARSDEENVVTTQGQHVQDVDGEQVMDEVAKLEASLAGT
eukprot:TRINITY_DN64557_c0_g1_i1.p1 TRINITY_DN64557_c0_g1~~TRINITY_DN64557_c0_g1_i1.p1  ORF type:complete len:910 (+),score=321.15 TRINITY_DN64557_c0_g1_i1:64-2793(+)